MKRNFVWSWIGVLMAATVLSIVSSVLNTPAAEAFSQPQPGFGVQTLAYYKDAATINLYINVSGNFDHGRPLTYFFNNVDFVDSDMWDNNFNYKADIGGCTSQIDLPARGSGTGKIHLETQSQYGAGCIGADYTTTIDKTDLGLTMFNWQDKQNLISVVQNVLLGQLNGGLAFDNQNIHQDLMNLNNSVGPIPSDKIQCGIHIDVQPNKIDASGTISCTRQSNLGSTSRTNTFHNIKIGNLANSTLPPGAGPPPPNTNNGPTFTCNVPYISWIVCPLISIGIGVVTWLDGQIINLLETPDLSGSGSQGIWNALKDFSNVFFVLVFLYIIFANTLSLQVDSYTIKKMLPRLIVAAILVQLSFTIGLILVDISNIVGKGLLTLLPNVGNAQSQKGYQTAGLILGALTGFGVTAGGIAVAAAAGPEVIVGVAIMALLLIFSGIIAIFGVFFTLTFRLILIQLALVLSPLAIVAWILPNTQRAFKFWYQNLLKALIMFPLITLLIAAANLFNQIGNGAGSGNFVTHMAASLAPIVAFFMIPATFKMAGGLMTAVSGAVLAGSSKFSKRARSGAMATNAKNSLKEKAARSYADGKDIQGLGGKIKRAGGRIYSGNAFSFGKTGQRKLATAVDTARATTNKDNLAFFDQIGADNKALQAIYFAADKGEKTAKFKDKYDNDQEVKVNKTMAETAIAKLVSSGGIKELGEILDYGEGGIKEGTWGKGIYDHENNRYRDAQTEATFKRAYGSNSGNVMSKIIHAVHGQGDNAYSLMSAGNMASAHSVDAETLSTMAMANDKAKANTLEQLAHVTNSEAQSGDMDQSVAQALKDKMTGAYEGQMVQIGDRTITVDQWLDETIKPGGQVQYYQAPVRILPAGSAGTGGVSQLEGADAAQASAAATPPPMATPPATTPTQTPQPQPQQPGQTFPPQPPTGPTQPPQGP